MAPMDPLIMTASAFAAVNVLLLAALTLVWVRNYQAFGTSLVAGLIVFGGVMLLENAIALYFFLSMQMFYAGDLHVQQAVAVLRGLQFVALVFLTYVTMK
jgi:hypothetical protein